MSATVMRDGKVVPTVAREAGLHGLSKPCGNAPILHSDLIGCATDLVLCRESGLDAYAKADGYEFEGHLADVRAEAAAYLLAVFEHARCGSD